VIRVVSGILAVVVGKELTVNTATQTCLRAIASALFL